MKLPFLGGLKRRLRAVTTDPILAELERQSILLGQVRLQQLAEVPPTALRAAECRVFSQGGEDGIIEKLIQHLPGIPETFVEFGVQDYREANTRFLLMNRDWKGLVLDGSAAHVRSIQQQEISVRHDLSARCAFITRENINDLVGDFTSGDALGLLSVDIDGNDYWVWQAMHVRPWIVVCEYNSLFGPHARITVPYRPDFDRTRAHHSNLYFGASIAALAALGAEQGYTLLDSNAMGTNAFFVRSDLAAAFRPRTPGDAHVAIRSRQSRDAEGHLTFLSFEQAVATIRGLPVVDLATGRERPIGEVCGV